MLVNNVGVSEEYLRCLCYSFRDSVSGMYVIIILFLIVKFIFNKIMGVNFKYHML
jgi:hypothetical protein